MMKIDFFTLTRGEVTSLSGQPRGLQARDHFRLDELDKLDEPVVVTAPQNLEALTPSFVQGLFGNSVHSLGPEKFFAHYQFDLGADLLADIRVGIQRALMRREIAGAA